MRLVSSILSVSLFVLLLAGCVYGKPSAGLRADDNQADEQSRRLASGLGRDDVFEVRIYGQPALSNTYRVSSEGTIVFPLLGEIKVAQKTSSELEKELAERLEAGFLQHAYVSILIKESNSKKVYVFGQVQRPGTFPYDDNMSLIQSITLAGGFLPNAAKTQVSITRRVGGKDVRITLDVTEIMKGQKKNQKLNPGDIVFVPETLF